MNNLEYGQVLAYHTLRKILPNINSSMFLKRQSKYGAVKHISPSVRYGSCDITPYLNHGEYNSIVKEFLETLETKLPHCSTTRFYSNIRTLTMTERIIPVALSPLVKIRGIYSADKNRITVSLTDNVPLDSNKFVTVKHDVTTHELIHMATTAKKGIVVQCGFKQSIGTSKDSASMGEGLNEGYTELINTRYFTNERVTPSYSEQQFIAFGLEELVGREKMESLFFDANLEGLLDELCKYAPKKQVVDLCHKIDLCHAQDGYDKKAYHRLAKSIRTEIANMQLIKLKQQLATSQITETEYQEQKLRTAFYTKGYIYDPRNSGYGYRHHTSFNGKLISADGHRLILKYFSETSTSDEPFTESKKVSQEDIVEYADLINDAIYRDHIDLSQIETITPSSSAQGYTVTTKAQSELSSMLQEEKTEESKKHQHR